MERSRGKKSKYGASPSGSKRRKHKKDTSQSEEEEERSSEEDLARKVEKLERDIIRRDRELGDEREETEHALERIKKLEREKVELRRDVEEAREEAIEYRRALEEAVALSRQSRRDASEEDVVEDLKDKDITIQGKNREIERLLEDVEKLEEDKGVIQEKLEDLKESLKDATEVIQKMTQENVDLRRRTEEAEELARVTCDEKNVLELREKDLLAYKERQDQYLETFSSAVDVRVEVWKTMMFEKDDEIERLESKLNSLLARVPGTGLDTEHSSMEELKSRLKEREEQILTLNDKLGEATECIESYARKIEELNSRLVHTRDPEQSERTVSALEGKIRKLQREIEGGRRHLQQAERDAEQKSRELTAVESRMAEYEAGEYGLAEAVAEIKEQKVQLRVRNEQICQLTAEINTAQMELSELWDESGMLREKLGLDPTFDLREDTTKWVKNRKNELSLMASKILQLEEEIIQLKTKNYSLKKQLKMSLQQGEEESSLMVYSSEYTSIPKKPIQKELVEGGSEWREKYEVILEENSELRRGLQEILDTLRRISEEGSSEVTLESPILENLLREMSARGLINYPYSIGGFHSKVCNLEGKNSQLREEVLRLRGEEKQLRLQLSESNGKIQVLEHKLEQNSLKVQEYLTSTLMLTCPDPKIHVETLSSTSFPDVPSLDRLDGFSQTDLVLDFVNGNAIEVSQDSVDCQKLQDKIESLRSRISELELSLSAKDQVMEGLRGLTPIPRAAEDCQEMQETLSIAHETIASLQERLKSKEASISQYQCLVGEIRGEMSAACERHVQELRVLQATIHQQQQAFTRIKSTLSSPVRDTSCNVESTIKDQLTRIHELEDEVSELQHALGNVASQLTTARSDAHKWRLASDARIKEIDALRDKISTENIEEMHLLREKLSLQQELINQWQSRLPQLGDGRPESPADVLLSLRTQLEEKEKEIEIYAKAFQMSGVSKDKVKGCEEELLIRDRELDECRRINKGLSSKISGLQVQLSKIKAVNQKSGLSAEMEDLKAKCLGLTEDRNKLIKQLEEIESRKVEEDLKRRKATESVVRWEENKKWERTVRKLEGRTKDLEVENQRLLEQVKALKGTVERLEKEKYLLDGKIKAIRSSASTSKASTDAEGPPDDRKLKVEVEELKRVLEQTEFEGREVVERLRMEIRCLKERIITQERSLTALQIAGKGDPKIVAEIEKMGAAEDALQTQLLHLEEENLQLRLQMEQLRLDTPRLRDRVQHLQKLVDLFKNESRSGGSKASSKGLGELERTICMLKSVIDKLQKENKQLKFSPGSSLKATPADRMKNTIEEMMGEKRELVERCKYYEEEKDKFQRLFLEACGKVEGIERGREEAERRSKSLELKLKTFFGDQVAEKGGVPPEMEERATGAEVALYQKIRDLQQDLDRKNKLLGDAKVSLKQVAFAKSKQKDSKE